MVTREDFDLEQSDFHVSALITKGVTLFTGDPKSGKSLAALYLGVCTAGDGEFLGFSTRHGHVCYLNNEHGEGDSHERWVDKFCLGLRIIRDDQFQLRSFHRRYQDLTNERQVNELLSVCLLSNTILLIVDNLGSSIGQQKEENHTIQKFYHNLNKFTECGITVIVIHHFKKNEKIYRGPTSIPAQVDREYSLTPVTYRERQSKNEDGEHVWLNPDTPLMVEVLQEFDFRCTIARGEKPPALLIGVEEDDLTGATKLVQKGLSNRKSPLEEGEEDVLEILGASPERVWDLKQMEEATGRKHDQKALKIIFASLIEQEKAVYGLVGKTKRYSLTGNITSKEQPFSDVLEEETSLALLGYRVDGRRVIPLTELVERLSEALPALLEVRDNSRLVAKIVRSMGCEVKKYRNGGWSHVFLPL